MAQITIDQDGNVTHNTVPHLPGASFDDATPSAPVNPLSPTNPASPAAPPSAKPWTNPPPLSNEAAPYQRFKSDFPEGTKAPDMSGIEPVIPGASTTPLPLPETVDQQKGIIPGADSQMPGANDPYVQNLYKQNAQAGQNLNNIKSSMNLGNMGSVFAPLQGMFDMVTKLAGGVGQKGLAHRELARAQAQLQEHEKNQAYAAYHQSMANSRQQQADSSTTRADAYALRQQSAAEPNPEKKRLLTAQADAAEAKTKETNARAALLNPAGAPAPAGAPPQGAPSAPNAGDHGGAVRTFTARGGTLVTLNKDNTITDANGRFYDSTGNPK